jgi:hypothetical protein
MYYRRIPAIVAAFIVSFGIRLEANPLEQSNPPSSESGLFKVECAPLRAALERFRSKERIIENAMLGIHVGDLSAYCVADKDSIAATVENCQGLTKVVEGLASRDGLLYTVGLGSSFEAIKSAQEALCNNVVSERTVLLSPGQSKPVHPNGDRKTVSCLSETQKLCKCEKPAWGGAHVFLKLYQLNVKTAALSFVTLLQEIPVRQNRAGVFFYSEAAEVCQIELRKNLTCF